MATFRTFAGSTDQVANGTIYVFKQTGEVAIERETFRPTYTKETAHGRADIGGNYEQLPAFGSYDALLNQERVGQPK